jgi:membrane-bound serine protease (ClpP class)
VSTVEKAVSSSALEAVAVGAVDGIAVSLEDVRRQADGQVVEVGAQPVTVDIAGAPFVDLPMNPFQSVIHLLSDPNIAFILFTIGFYGLLFELQSPNFVTGILGAIALILAFIGFGSLPLSVAGLLLIGLAIVLFLLEFTVTSHGLLMVGGLICFVLGAFALYTPPGTPTAPDVTVAAPLVFFMAGW